MTKTLVTLPCASQSSISRTLTLVSGLEAFGLSNQAQLLARSGDLARAEHLHLKALDIKTKAFGLRSPQVASTLHSLAEIQIRLGKYNGAEQSLREAVSIRTASNKHHDFVQAAKSRELLAQVLETSGNLSAAKNVRLAGQPDRISCGNSKAHLFVCALRTNSRSL
jgi:tetratricopeptide (TPR) repeat protein